MKIILMIVAVIIFCYSLHCLMDWKMSLNRTYPRIKFKVFKNLYLINSEKWTVEADCVIYYPNKKYEYNKIYMNFATPLDLKKYHSFLKQKDKYRQVKIAKKCELIFAEDAQKEIEKYRKEIKEEVEKHLETVQFEDINFSEVASIIN